MMIDEYLQTGDVSREDRGVRVDKGREVEPGDDSDVVAETNYASMIWNEQQEI